MLSFQEEIQKFKHQYIYKHIIDTEAREHSYPYVQQLNGTNLLNFKGEQASKGHTLHKLPLLKVFRRQYVRCFFITRGKSTNAKRSPTYKKKFILLIRDVKLCKI